MYLSLDQILASLENLQVLHPFFGMSYLAFKKADIPVGSARPVNFTQIATSILDEHYRLSSDYDGYYNPFRTSKTKDDRWTKPRYPSTSLQRITTDTFSDVLIHTKNTSNWGWKDNFVDGLKKHLGGKLIPGFDLAVWMYRNQDHPVTHGPVDLLYQLFSEYNISKNERDRLFEKLDKQPHFIFNSEVPVSEFDLLRIIGFPPGAQPESGAALLSLDIQEVGPATKFHYEPAERLNIITGDNSLGKTFLLDCIWWALTNEWLEYPVLPRKDPKRRPKISFELSTMRGRLQRFESIYNFEHQSWTPRPENGAVAGLVIYARYDGSFAVWDPSRRHANTTNISSQINKEQPMRLLFTRHDILYGIQNDNGRGWISNGLFRDWISWQTRGESYGKKWASLIASLAKLSPTGETIEPGEPTKLPFDELEIPTIRMPYGEIPVTQASAGIQRALALAYILVWTWFSHLDNSAAIQREPQKRLVLILDEAEAHLHPRWQRVIVPALMNVIANLAVEVSPQIHLATHSPMVMASAETVFDASLDNLHHMRPEGNGVVIDELAFEKRGRADLWLTSDVFGLAQARSLPAENAITSALGLLMKAASIDSDDPEETTSGEVHAVNQQLVRYLAQDDDFWPRWRFFARRYLKE